MRDALRAMAADADLYQRDRALVHVVGASPSEDRERAPLAEGTPIVRTMSLSTFWERASDLVRWEKWDVRSEEFTPADPPNPVLAAILSRGDYPGIRPLTGILEAPALRPDGSLIFGRGYDAQTGFLCLPTTEFAPPVAEPTQADAVQALAELREIFADFPHRNEASRMVPVAAILTVLARPSIAGACPGFLLDASTRGSGKTLQADAVAVVTTGRIPPPMSYPHDDEELEKVLGAYAMKAPQIIKFDNVTRTFGGGPIDRILTAEDTTTFRVLGRSELPELSWRSIMLATGNNMSLTGDTSRRVLIGRLESPLENPEERAESDFAHPMLISWVREERTRLVRAALTVLRAWIVAGRPRMGCKTWGSFGPWSNLVPCAIVYAGGADPMLARPTATGEEEPEKGAVLGILAGLQRLDLTGRGMTAREIVNAVYTPDRLKGNAPPDGYDDLREGIEFLVSTRPGMQPDTTKLGLRLRSLAKDRVMGGNKLVAVPGAGHVQRWRVERAA